MADQANEKAWATEDRVMGLEGRMDSLTALLEERLPAAPEPPAEQTPETAPAPEPKPEESQTDAQDTPPADVKKKSRTSRAWFGSRADD